MPILIKLDLDGLGMLLSAVQTALVATIERSRGEGAGELGVVVDASAIAFSKVTVEFAGDPPATQPALAQRPWGRTCAFQYDAAGNRSRAHRQALEMRRGL